MSTTTLTPLPVLQARLAAAKAERLEPTLLTVSEGGHWSITQYDGIVPSTSGGDEHHVWVQDVPLHPLRCSCSCTAGTYGKACVHLAVVLDAFGLFDERYEHQVLKPEEAAQLVRGERNG